jgi:hypothetical protein
MEDIVLTEKQGRFLLNCYFVLLYILEGENLYG